MISVIIPCINEEDEVNATIKSLRETAGHVGEIIVVDDASHLPIHIHHPLVKLHRNVRRCGAAPSRHIGALMAEEQWLLFIDCHSRFDPEWYIQITDRLKSALESEVVCASCQGLSQTHKELPGLKAYYGATFTESLDAEWTRDFMEKEDCEIPCVMGACYFVSRKWFFHIDPYRWLRGWGCEEQMLSLKTWFAGGRVTIAPDVKIGHIFRGQQKSPHGLPKRIEMLNKMFMLNTVLSPQLANKVTSLIPHGPDKAKCLTEITRDWYLIEAEQKRNKSIFVKDYRWLAEKFELPI